MIDLRPIKNVDLEVYESLVRELNRQQNNVELIASENFVSLPVLTAGGTHLTNKYAEGYPDKRYYGGCMFVDEVEKLAIERAKKIDPNYTPPEQKKSGGCYVATCVYGSYDCPEVWTLRRYRDDTLGSTWYGRAFIRTYYAISPTLVKWFGKTKWFKKMWKGKLDRMVKKLQDKGVENTPYEDKDWKK